MEERFIGGILWGYLWRASWPLCELIITGDEVIVRARGPVRFVCPRGAKYSISRLSYVQRNRWGIRVVSPEDPRTIYFGSWPSTLSTIMRRLAERGIDVRDRKGRPLPAALS